MARLESQGKMGFYPTPQRTLYKIQEFLKVGRGTHLLDPCCGEGEALSSIGSYYGVNRYGVELDTDRAMKASSVLNVVQGSIFEARVNPLGCMGLLWLNPPYDFMEGKRMEFEFLKHSIKWLSTEGVLVYIIPEHVLDENLREWLEQHFHSISVYRIASDEYPKFKQVVLFGYKKEKREKTGEIISIDDLKYIDIVADSGDVLPEYVVPATEGPKVFQSGITINPEEISVNKNKVLAEIKRISGWEDKVTSCQPILPVRMGHRVSLITNGLLDGKIENPDGSFILLRGFSSRTTSTREEDGKEIRKDSYSVGIRVMESTGKWYDVV